MKKISIIVPCYNEENNIKKFYAESEKNFEKQKYTVEYVFINDGSKDNTLYELKQLLQKKQKIKIINFSRNFGKEAAIYAGLKVCSGDYAVLIDADLQQPPRLILEMLFEIETNKDVDIVAYYQEKRIEGKFVSFCKSRFYKLINRISKLNFVNGASDFRLFNRTVINSILEFTDQNRFQKGIFAYIGFNTKFLPYIPEKRYAGKTSWNFFKLINYAINGILSFTDAPLKIIKYFGLIEMFTSFIWLLILLIIRSSSLIQYFSILLVFLSSIFMISIYILSIFVYRSYCESRNRPLYIVKEIIESE